MRNVAGTGLLMAGSSFLNLLLNFAAQIYLAYRFGAGMEMDAYVGAMTLPALFGAVLIPSMGIVIVPMFVESLQKRGAAASGRLASTVVNAIALVLTGVVALTLAFASPLMRRLVPGLDPPTLALAVRLMYWLMPATIFSTLVAALSGLHQAQRRFTPTAISPVAGALVLLGTAVALTPSLGMRGIAMATLLGAVVQFVIVVPVLRGHYRPVLDLSDRAVRTVGGLLLPLIAGGLIYRATIVADRLVASMLPEGSLSHIEFASRIAVVINTLFAAGIATTLYPLMSTQAAEGDYGRLAELLVRGQRVTMLFLFPALAIAFVLRVPLLHVMFQRGEFAAADTLAVADILTWYLLGVVGGTLGALQAKVYYVLKDTVTPVVLGLVETAAYFAYVPFLAARYGAAGVGISNAIYMIGALVLNGVFVMRRLPPGHSTELFLDATRIGLLATAGAAAAWAASRLTAVPLARLAIGAFAGLAVYALLMWMLRAKELRELAWLRARRSDE